MATAEQAQAAYDALQAKLAATNRSITYFTNQLKGPVAGRAKATKMLAALKVQLGTYKKQIPALQNNLWEATGQYDKLLTGENRDAFMAVNALFKDYGLESLAGKIYEYVKNGYSPDTVSILLQDTPEYKQRFAGNEKRRAAGLPVLSPAEYLATEASYRQIMQSAGMPSGFYDSHSDFNDWIGKNISPSEVQSRVEMATQATILSNPDYRKALNQMGIDDAHLTAYFLDTNRALPYLQKAAATAQVGAEALRSGLSFDQTYAEQLSTMGVSADQARQGYQQVAGELGTMGALGTIYGDAWSQRQSESAVFGTEGSAAAQTKQKRLLSQERGAFGGREGSAAGGGLSSGGGAR